jgi:hypothetical protein
MAHAQRLEGEVRSMRSKIKQLEDALAKAQQNSNPAQDVSSLHTRSPQDFNSSIPTQPGFNEVDDLGAGSYPAGVSSPTKEYGIFAGSGVSFCYRHGTLS